MIKLFLKNSLGFKGPIKAPYPGVERSFNYFIKRPVPQKI